MERHAVIVHGWEGYPLEGWFLWLKSELESKGFRVEVPEMPETLSPKIEPWVSTLKEQIGKADENLVLIGHSIGCQAIWRYLETLKEGEKIAGAVLVAPWTKLNAENALQETESEEIVKPWLDNPIDWKKVKRSCKRFVVIFSDDDPYVYLDEGELFKEKLDAKVIVEHKMGHFSGDDEILELPSAKQAVLEISK